MSFRVSNVQTTILKREIATPSSLLLNQILEYPPYRAKPTPLQVASASPVSLPFSSHPCAHPPLTTLCNPPIGVSLNEIELAVLETERCHLKRLQKDRHKKLRKKAKAQLRSQTSSKSSASISKSPPAVPNSSLTEENTSGVVIEWDVSLPSYLRAKKPIKDKKKNKPKKVRLEIVFPADQRAVRQEPFLIPLMQPHVPLDTQVVAAEPEGGPFPAC